ncbi:Clas33 [Clostera anastomosis granulovirus B]|uniref:Clas33 n=1 Tax=Clostera anastomosis granulovirus B TaxID=1986290 RepID=A0A0K0WS59_9BBAC|nr:Clas33 [Clostera anastomosis granulovirus B]AKS25376.1 Clas33 [Clostera anastomosis granulovirus B]
MTSFAEKELEKNLEIHKLAIEALKRDLEYANNETVRLTNQQIVLTNEWNAERSNWCLVDKQQNEVITTLAEQLRKVDNELQNFLSTKQDNGALKNELLQQTKLLISTKKELLAQTKKNKSLKKKVKELKAFIIRCNDSLDDIICDGDSIVDK